MRIVKMKFPKDMFYDDLKNPLYRAGEVYEISDEDKGMIARWTKRGGVIVDGTEAVAEGKEETPESVPAKVPKTIKSGRK